MKPIIIQNTITLTTTVRYKTPLTEEVYNALLKKYRVEIVDDRHDKCVLPSFEEYYNGLLNPDIVYKEFPNEPYVQWYYYKDKNHVPGQPDYYSGDWIEGYTRPAGTYHCRNSFREAIEKMIDREYHLYCHKKNYPVADEKEYSFLPEEECVVPFEEYYQDKDALTERTKVDIPSKVEVRYYE